MKKYISILALFLSMLQWSYIWLMSPSFADDEYENEDSQKDEYENENFQKFEQSIEWPYREQINTESPSQEKDSVQKNKETISKVANPLTPTMISTNSKSTVTKKSLPATPYRKTSSKQNFLSNIKTTSQVKGNPPSTNSQPIKSVSTFISPNGKIFPIIYNETKATYSYLENGNVSSMHSLSKAEIIAFLSIKNPASPNSQVLFESMVLQTGSPGYSKAVAIAEAQCQEMHEKSPDKAFAFERPNTPSRLLLSNSWKNKILTKWKASTKQQNILTQNIEKKPKSPPPTENSKIGSRKVVQKPVSRAIVKSIPIIVKKPTLVKVTPKPTPTISQKPVEPVKVVTPPVVNLPPPDTTTRAS